MEKNKNNKSSINQTRLGSRNASTSIIKSQTLEEMIMQLEIEEKEASEEYCLRQRRMSFDIQQPALNLQYPRFSLDGREAVYRRYSFLNMPAATKPISTLAGASVIWCKPGVVAKLMGLDALPMRITSTANPNVNAKDILIQKIMKRA
ncbi:hypothetical protein ACFE04_026242 [Oxalis oulophora]